jgi:hypothetical protein
MRENVGQRSRKRGWPRCPPPATQHCLACALPRQSVWDGHWARRRREAVSVHWLDAGGSARHRRWMCRAAGDDLLDAS